MALARGAARMKPWFFRMTDPPGRHDDPLPLAEAAPAQDHLSPLTLRRVGIDTYRENVAYMHRECDRYRAEGFQALAKVEVRADGQRILATLNVVDDAAIVSCGELGLSEEAFATLGSPRASR